MGQFSVGRPVRCAEEQRFPAGRAQCARLAQDEVSHIADCDA
jgi:hypothetical protein